MATTKLNSTLQENLITLLCYDDQQGKIVSQLVEPILFEGEYRVIAERAVSYWQKFGEAPKTHTPDLVADFLDDKKNRQGVLYRKILSAMLDLSGSVNANYVVDQLRKFVRLQRFKVALHDSASKLVSKQELALEEVEQIWDELLRSREIDYEHGLKLTEFDRVLNYLTYSSTEFTTGVPEFDKRGITPARKTLGCLLAPPKRGKSWWLIHLGRQALLARKKVLHITLEMPEDQCGQRYYQMLFSVSKREADKITVPVFKRTKGRLLRDIVFEDIEPEFSFERNTIRDELEVRVDALGKKLDNIIIKQFPPRTLTPARLRAYLDHLEIVEKFIPDLIIVDYIGIMHTDAKNHRISLGRAVEELRGIAVERNVAIETVHQTSREGVSALRPDETVIAEDWSIVGTVDRLMIFTRTEAEKKLGLGRIYVTNVRNDEDSIAVLLTQNYKIGQFRLDSIELDKEYFNKLKDLDEGDEEEEHQSYVDDDDLGDE